jgi:hypothetical protein
MIAPAKKPRPIIGRAGRNQRRTTRTRVDGSPAPGARLLMDAQLSVVARINRIVRRRKGRPAGWRPCRGLDVHHQAKIST